MQQTLSDHLSNRFSIRSWRVVLGWALIDACVIVLAYTAAFAARALAAPLHYLDTLPFISFATLITLVMLYLAGVYQRMWSYTSGHQITVIIKGFFFATLLVLVADLWLYDRPLPLSVVLLGNVLALGGVVTVRYRSRLLRGLAWRWRVVWRLDMPERATRILIVGAARPGQILALRLREQSLAGRYHVVGFVDNNSATQKMYVEGAPVLGTYTDIPRLVGALAVDLIVISEQNIQGQEFRQIFQYCQQTGARIQAMPDLLSLMEKPPNAVLLRDIQLEDFIGRHSLSYHASVDLTPLRKRVVMITGAAGSIGSELAQQIFSVNPTKIILLENNESALHDLHTILSTKFPQHTIVPVLVDVTHRAALAAVFREHQIQVVFHTAAYKHVPMLERFPDEALRVNVGGTYNLAQLARDFGVQRFVLISTDKAVNPSSVMGASKRICELLVHALGAQTDHNTRFAVVRFGNVLNSRGSVVPTFERQIENGGPVTVTHPDMTRFFMSIPEAVNLLIHAACLTRGNDTFILRMGEEVRIVEIAERMIRMRGLRPYQDIEIKFTGMRPGEKLYEELYTSQEEISETVHPHVYKVKSQQVVSQTDEFLAAVCELLANGINPQQDARQQLLALEKPAVYDAPIG